MIIHGFFRERVEIIRSSSSDTLDSGELGNSPAVKFGRTKIYQEGLFVAKNLQVFYIPNDFAVDMGPLQRMLSTPSSWQKWQFVSIYIVSKF